MICISTDIDDIDGYLPLERSVEPSFESQIQSLSDQNGQTPLHLC